MSKKRWKSAEDLMSELETDPVYRQRRQERDEKFRRLEEQYAELARPILDELSAKGFEADSIEHLVKKYAPLPSEAIAIILAHIEPGQDARHCERLVRAAAAAKSPFDGTRLAMCYDTTTDESLRWAIANTIALARPHSIEGWLALFPDESPLRRALKDLDNNRAD